MKKVRDVMNTNVIWFKPEDNVFEVAKVLSEKNISGAPVVEKGKVVGIISVSDIVRFLKMKLKIGSVHEMPSLSLLFLDLIKTGKDFIELKKEIKKISDVKIKSMMSRKVVCIDPEASIFDAANLMDKHDVNRLPVVENGKLVGIIARADIIRAIL
ncbi:MAG: CBS domain-containing protein [Candidatus Aenigmatarchaeota archaeon]